MVCESMPQHLFFSSLKVETDPCLATDDIKLILLPEILYARLYITGRKIQDLVLLYSD
jgi:hypothetical protein